MATDCIRILLIDDHSMIHRLVATLLETVTDVVLVGQGSSGLDALPLYTEHKPDVVLMDVVMPGMNGIEATQHVLESFPDARILVLSGFQDDDSVRAMLQAGAAGYVLKISLAKDLLNGIRAVASGATILSSPVAQAILNQPLRPTAHNSFALTVRELEVLRLMAEGLGNKEVASSLVISVSTVKFHLANILEKMGVNTRSEAIVLAAKDGLL